METGSVSIDPQIIFRKIKLLPGQRVADLGVGRTGHILFQASKVVGDKGIVYAVDIIKNILEGLESRVRSEGYTNVQTIWSDIERLGKTPIPPASVNAALLINILYLVKEKVTTLQEAARLTASGGYVVVVEWLKKLGPLGPDEGMLVRPQSVIDNSKVVGLTLVENFPLGDCHYCLIFRK